jgi:SAM-dependent methyltransferase
MSTTAFPVHPFPARMAPELALGRLPMGRRERIVLDPMMGSGTIPVLAAMHGHHGIGFDTDPLAVLIAATTGRVLPAQGFMQAAERVCEWARSDRHVAYEHPDSETQKFIEYWFDPVAQRHLGALARSIARENPRLRRQLWCAFSRLIITKDAGASRARDVSHSRPHRVREFASFDPIERFLDAAEAVWRRHRALGKTRPAGGALRLSRGDARRLPLSTGSVDAVITSPPYLQAIDYLRGHRLSLVWMGFTLAELRELRGASIGSERGAQISPANAAVLARAASPALDARGVRIVARYINDFAAVLDEIARVLRPAGQITLVVADATVRGTPVSVSAIVDHLASIHGMTCTDRLVREIAGPNRYLPPPTDGSNALDRRMRVEHCLTYRTRKRSTARRVPRAPKRGSKMEATATPIQHTQTRRSAAKARNMQEMS